MSTEINSSEVRCCRAGCLNDEYRLASPRSMSHRNWKLYRQIFVIFWRRNALSAKIRYLQNAKFRSSVTGAFYMSK